MWRENRCGECGKNNTYKRVHICMGVRTHTHVHLHIHTHRHTHINAHIHTRIHLQMNIHMHVLRRSSDDVFPNRGRGGPRSRCSGPRRPRSAMGSSSRRAIAHGTNSRPNLGREAPFRSGLRLAQPFVRNACPVRGLCCQSFPTCAGSPGATPVVPATCVSRPRPARIGRASPSSNQGDVTVCSDLHAARMPARTQCPERIAQVLCGPRRPHGPQRAHGLWRSHRLRLGGGGPMNGGTHME